MRDEKEISSQIESNADKLFGKDWLTKLAYSAGYMDGIAYADNHPNWEEIVERMRKEIANDLRNDRWISVEDKLPEYDQKVLWCWDDGLISIGRVAIDEQHIEAGYITHWCHLPQPPVLSNSENTGKDHLIDANNMIDHFADASKKVEKGGEE